MKFIYAKDGEVYTPEGHDAAVQSRLIYKNEVNIHTTTFPAGGGMAEEAHEHLSHIFYVMEREMQVLQGGRLQETLTKGDSVYIPAGEYHEIKNASKKSMTFFAVTFPE